MGKRFAIVIGAAALGAALIAVGASANFRSVDDPRGDTRCIHDGGSHRPCSGSAKRNADIVRATAGHEGRLRHTIRVVGKIQRGYLTLNTDSDRDCEYVLFAPRGQGRTRFRGCADGHRAGRARMDFHRHSVEIFFRRKSIGNPGHYGWSASAWDGPAAAHAGDDVPNGRYPSYITHQLG